MIIASVVCVLLSCPQVTESFSIGLSREGEFAVVGATSYSDDSLRHQSTTATILRNEGGQWRRAVVLRPEIEEAISNGRFNIWAVDTVEEAIDVVTGLGAGQRGGDGRYDEGTVFRFAEDTLDTYSNGTKGDLAGLAPPSRSPAGPVPGIPPPPPPEPPIAV